jgi:hypothetical protein
MAAFNIEALAEQLAGTTWSVASTANPAAANGTFDGIWCASPTSCTFVGSYFGSDGAQEGLISQWDGTNWASTTFNEAGAAATWFSGVSCAGGTCVAVGGYMTSSEDVLPLAATEKSGTWALSNPLIPNGTTELLVNSVSCESATLCVAAGGWSNATTQEGIAETWNGTTWSYSFVQSPPGATEADLYGVSCTAGTQGTCVAVGQYSDASSDWAAFAAVQTGATWDPFTPYGSNDGELDAVSCVTATDCTAVGSTDDDALSATYNGANWAPTIIPPPDQAPSAELLSVSCSPTSCTAVGDLDGGNGNQPIVATTTGASWVTSETSALNSSQRGLLTGVACPTSSTCLATGFTSSDTTEGTATTLVLTGTEPAPPAGGGSGGLPAQTPTAISLEAAPNPASTGQEVLYTATVAPAPDTGTVSFSDNGAVIAACASVQLTDTGEAVCPMTYSSAGNHSVTAAYPGDGLFSASTSAAASEVVNQAPPTSGPSTPATPTKTPLGFCVASAAGVAQCTVASGIKGSLPSLGIHVSNVVGIAATPGGKGVWMAGADGSVYGFGNVKTYGSLPGRHMDVRNVVGIAATPDGKGYWLVRSNGTVYNFGDAGAYGTLPGRHVKTTKVVSIAAAPDGKGYWMATSNGNVYNFGSAGAYGTLPGRHVTAKAVVAIAGTPDGKGYWMVSSSGSVYAFGDARRRPVAAGSHAPTTNVVGLAPTTTGDGYWLATSTGGVCAFGDATVPVGPVPSGPTTAITPVPAPVA